jgi:hypothetical protein
MTKLSDLLSETISDEEAYHLVNFFMSLALELESHYFTQINRHLKQDIDYPEYLRGKPNDELPF